MPTTDATDLDPTDLDPTDVDPAILRRVRALLNKAESTTYADEAAAFTAKAQAVMARYAISQVLVDRGGDADEVTSRRILIQAPYQKPKFTLLSAVARANRCQAILGVPHAEFHALENDELDGKAEPATVFGFAADIDTVELLVTSLLLQATNVMHSHGSIQEFGRNRTRSFRHSFLLGFARSVGQRLDAANQTTTAEADRAAGGSLLPVLVDRDAQVEAAVDAACPHLRRLTTSLSSGSGLQAGRTAGHRADLGTTRLGRAARELPRG